MGADVSWALLGSETHFTTITAELAGKLWCCFGHPKTSPWSRRKLSNLLSPCWDPIAHSWIILCCLLAATSLPYPSSYPAPAFLNIPQALAGESLSYAWVENPSPAPHTPAPIPG